MDWSNLIVQLGISALVLFVVFRIGMKLIENNAKSDAARTDAIKDGFAADIAAHQAISSTMQAMQTAVTAAMTGLQNQFYRVEGKLDTVLDLTPVRGLRGIEAADLAVTPEPSVVVDKSLTEDDDTPVDRPPQPQQSHDAPGLKKPRPSSVGGVYGIGGVPPHKPKR